MSCYIVNPTDMASVAKTLGALHNPSYWDMSEPNPVREFVENLWLVNKMAFCYRYPSERGEPVSFPEMLELVKASDDVNTTLAELTRYPGDLEKTIPFHKGKGLDAKELYGLLRSIAYQCAEFPGNEEPQILRQLDEIIYTLGHAIKHPITLDSLPKNMQL